MKKPQLLWILIILSAFACGQLYAEDVRLGRLVFEDATYPQAVGNTGKISFYKNSFDEDNKVDVRIHIGDPATGKSQEFNLELDTVPAVGRIAWKSDGQHLAVVRTDLTPCDIYTYTRKKPFEIERLTDLLPHKEKFTEKMREALKLDQERAPFVATQITWSDNDSLLAFLLINLSEASLWIYDSGSERVRRVTERNVGQYPSFSHDGTKIYFSGTGKSSGYTSDDIFVLDIEDYSYDPVIATPASELNPQVSPDGRYLVYGYRERGDRQTIHVSDLKTGKTAPLVILGETGACANPIWSADGKTVYYQYNSGKTFLDIYAIDFSPDIFK